ncbi:MAG: GtrA family protein [Lachnospiraceae bacterium]|nr:GtrA family protein [Lachnospiraceae bacterium]
MTEKPTLMQQIARFGLVGILCFIIDYVVYRLMNLLFEKAGIAEGFPQYIYVSLAAGFIVSVIVNYILSMRFVFVRKDDMSRRREFIIFLILSVIGLFVNELCMFIGMDLIYANWPWLQGLMTKGFAQNWFFKFGATGVVMVYNFITRKMFLEKKDGQEEEKEN